jgi:hypothetical protein
MLGNGKIFPRHFERAPSFLYLEQRRRLQYWSHLGLKLHIANMSFEVLWLKLPTSFPTQLYAEVGIGNFSLHFRNIIDIWIGCLKVHMHEIL